MAYKIENGKLVKENGHFINAASPKQLIFDALKTQVSRAEARTAQLEAERKQILEASSTLSEMLTDMWKERDELSAKLEQAHDACKAARDWFEKNTKQGHIPGPVEQKLIDALSLIQETK